MAAKPLSLKREKARRSPRAGKFSSVAEVLLDHEIVHLDGSFTYGIPEELIDELTLGSIVRVSFNNLDIDGVVVAINTSDEGTFKPISKIVKSAAYSTQAIRLATEVAKRYGTSSIRILKLFLKRKSPLSRSLAVTSSAFPSPRLFFPESAKVVNEVVKGIQKRGGSTLVFAPSEREVVALTDQLKAVLGDRVISFESWQKLPEASQANRVILGMRGMIFIQAVDISEIVIFDEGSEHYWEKRSPFWNLRDVALIKSQLESIPLKFISGTPSLELYRLSQSNYLELGKPVRQILKKKRFITSPESYHRTVRSGLESGAVLVSTSSKNYINSLSCKRCDTVPRCNCGFPLKLQADKRPFCSICGVAISELRCRECQGTEFIARGKGALRVREEFSKSFTNVPILLATSERELSIVPPHSIVIATPGVEPRSIRYAGVVLLDGLARISRPTLRSEEQLANHWFRLLALASDESSVYISLPNSHRISQALISGNPYRITSALLQERKETKLPPFYRIIKVKGDALSSLAEHLAKEFSGLEISKISLRNELTIRVEVSNAQEVISALHSLVKFRAASGKSSLSLEIDPHDI